MCCQDPVPTQLAHHWNPEHGVITLVQVSGSGVTWGLRVRISPAYVPRMCES